MSHLLCSLVLVVCVLASCRARPDGAPKSACASLMPAHAGIEPQKSSSPYTVSAVRNGNKVRVTITSPIGEEFEGFVVQARSIADPNRLVEGKFTRNELSKTVDCFGGKQNTLTQVNPNAKREIVTEWTPSGEIDEDIIFRATILKTFALFWTAIDSAPLRLWGKDGRGSSSVTPSGAGRSGSHPMYHDCYTSKGCFGYPSGCVTRADCEVLLSFSKRHEGILFTLHGYLQDNMYMAMGLSTDSKMGDDSVMECFRRGSDVVARQSWNEGKRNTNTRDLSRTSYSGDYTNGLTTCSWIAQYLTEANGRRYNLANNTYYVLLAKGSVTNGRLEYHSGRLATQEAINFTALQLIEGERVSDSIKIHGTFMVTAWVGFVSIGILLARHFKNTWEDSTLCGVKIWFALHRGFMITGLVFVVIAFIVIFVYKNGWNHQTSNPHAVLGCIATALGLFQPIMAAFRPAPDHPKRPIFNWMHFIVGKSAHIIAVITIFFAVSLESSGLSTSVYWVMAVFVVVHVIFHLMLQLHLWTSKKKKVNELSMNEMNGAGRQGQQNTQTKNVSGDVFRILLLGIYSIFLIVILIALYSLIGVA